MKTRSSYRSRAVLGVITAAMLVLTACGGKNSAKDPAHLSGINPDDYVTLAEYQSIPVEAEQYEITDEYLTSYIEYLLSMNTEQVEVTDRPVQTGDTVNIDYVGTKDGVAFDGGTAQGASLTIGSGQFIDGFEDGLIGHEIGETVELPLTFPEEYHSEELAGADVIFTVTINGISVYSTPELTDEWAAAQGIDGVTNSEQYRATVKADLEDQARESFENDIEEQAVTYLTDNSTFQQDPPTEMVDRLTESFTNTITQYAAMYGTDLAGFMQTYYGSAEDGYEQDIRDMAAETAKQYIIFQAIANRENLNISDTEWNTALSTRAAEAGYSSVKEYEENEDAEAYREYLMVQNVLEYLVQHAVVSAPANEADESAEE